MKGAAVLRLEKRYTDEMISHALADNPNECCGILAGAGGQVTRLYRGLNVAKNPVMRYDLDPRDLLRIYRDIETNGWDVFGIYHSHTHTQAYPSATDVELAFWPDSIYFIVSLQDVARPALRAFRLRDGLVEEETLEIV